MRKAIKGFLGFLGFEVVRRGSIPQDIRRIWSDFSREDLETVRALRAYTQTGPERVIALIRAVEYVIRNGIPGDFVECGVWKGGSMMAVAGTLLRLGVRDRDLYLYDTFEGLTEPSEEDVSHWGVRAKEQHEAYLRKETDGTDLFSLNVAPLEEVRDALHSVGYEGERIHFVKGRVEETLPGTMPEEICLLRLDTDWYESTKHELVHLFPRLSRGGVLLLDDYGEWQGARKAVDEYVEENRIPLLLNRIDYTGRIAVKI